MTTLQCNERLTGKPKDGQCQKCIEVVKGKSLFSLKQSFYLLLIELLSLFTTNLGKTKICGYKYSILQLDSGIKCYFQQASPFRTHSTLPQAPLPILHHSDKKHLVSSLETEISRAPLQDQAFSSPHLLPAGLCLTP